MRIMYCSSDVCSSNLSATDNPVRHGALLNVIGTVHRELGDDEKALEYFHRVASEGLEQRQPVNAAFTIPAIAHILLGQGRGEDSREIYGRARPEEGGVGEEYGGRVSIWGWEVH